MELTPREQILLSAVQGRLDRLMEAAARLLGCPLLLGDALLNVLAWTGSEPSGGQTWEDFIAAGWAPGFHPPPQGPDPSRAIPYGFTATPVVSHERGGWDTLVDLELGHGLTAHLVAVGLGPNPGAESDELLGVLCLSLQGLLRPERDLPFQTLSAGQFLLQLLREDKMEEALLRFRAGLAGLEPEQRERTIDTVYHMLCETNAETLHELKENRFSRALALLRSAKGLDEDTRKLLVHAAGVFFRSAGRSLKQARVPDEQES